MNRNQMNRARALCWSHDGGAGNNEVMISINNSLAKLLQELVDECMSTALIWVPDEYNGRIIDALGNEYRFERNSTVQVNYPQLKLCL
jgi:hypothetical protein